MFLPNHVPPVGNIAGKDVYIVGTYKAIKEIKWLSLKRKNVKKKMRCYTYEIKSLLKDKEIYSFNDCLYMNAKTYKIALDKLKMSECIGTSISCKVSEERFKPTINNDLKFRHECFSNYAIRNPASVILSRCLLKRI